jgi:NTE family protein
MTALVLGAGGERVTAWEVGVLAGLADAGWDPRNAEAIIGTSAGALVAARLAAGVDPNQDALRYARGGEAIVSRAPFAALAAAWEAAGGSVTQRRRALGRLAVKTAPGGEEEVVARLAPLLPAAWPAALRVVAIDADSGQRVVFDAAAGVPVARAVAASRAVPGLFGPVPIGSRRYIDGALGSATNADLAGRGAVVIAPLPRAASGGVEALWIAALQAELRVLGDALLIDAGPEDVAAMGPDPMSGATAPLAVAAGRARAAQIMLRRAA